MRNTNQDLHHSLRCNFAFPGTYGHECGAPATLTASRVSTETANGVYWTRRCAVCATHNGGENTGYGQFIPFNPETHRNFWR